MSCAIGSLAEQTTDAIGWSSSFDNPGPDRYLEGTSDFDSRCVADLCSYLLDLWSLSGQPCKSFAWWTESIFVYDFLVSTDPDTAN